MGCSLIYDTPYWKIGACAMRLKIAGGRLYDPTCGWDGEAGDLYIEDGRLVAPLPEVDREIEARGQIVTAGGD